MPEPPDQPAERLRIRVLLRRTRSELTLRREADMMGFTVAIALIAALSTGNDHAAHSTLDILAVVWGTTIGLALVHWFALSLSARLVRDPNLRYSPLEMLLAQHVMAVLVAATATVVVLVASDDFERLGARATAALFIGVLVGIEVRTGGSTTRRALTWSIGALTVALAVATVKWFFGRRVDGKPRVSLQVPLAAWGVRRG